MRDYDDKLKFIPRDGWNETDIVIGNANIDKFVAAQMRKL